MAVAIAFARALCISDHNLTDAFWRAARGRESEPVEAVVVLASGRNAVAC